MSANQAIDGTVYGPKRPYQAPAVATRATSVALALAACGATYQLQQAGDHDAPTVEAIAAAVRGVAPDDALAVLLGAGALARQVRAAIVRTEAEG